MNVITVIDLQVCNIKSVVNMFEFLGYKTNVLRSPEDSFTPAQKFVLPGVGAFAPAAESLHASGWFDYLKPHAKEVRILGICIGMHLLGLDSDEGQGSGLGFIESSAKRIESSYLPVPNVGWRDLTHLKKSNLFEQSDNSIFYFSHSFNLVCKNKQDVISTFSYGEHSYAAVVSSANAIGVQFHPEKSHKHGLKFLEKFAELNA